jgi:oxysterol-binding protein 1
MRPDQRAFEQGRYERANVLKIALEEKQRATRRERETGALPPHSPRWFSSEIDADTGERVWAPKRVDDGGLAYWAERAKVFQAGGRDKPGGAWSDVVPIFLTEDEVPDS